MKRLIIALAMALSLAGGLIAPAATSVNAAPLDQSISSTGQVSIRLNPATPNSFTVSGSIININPAISSAVVTLTLKNGQIASQIVGAANGWAFNFTSVPNDGWQNIAVSETTVGSPSYVTAGGSIPAYVFNYPYVGTNYSLYNWGTGYPAYTYSPGTYFYRSYPVNQLGYTYSGFSPGINSSYIYPTNTFSPYGSGYYYANGRYYFYPYTQTALNSYYSYDYLNSYRYTVPTGYASTYYYTPPTYTSGYFVNPAVYFGGTGNSVGYSTGLGVK